MKDSIGTIRRAIKTSGMSYRELAETSGVHHVSIWRFANDERQLRSDSIGKLIAALGLDIVTAK